jgi:hypothetical protein
MDKMIPDRNEEDGADTVRQLARRPRSGKFL